MDACNKLGEFTITGVERARKGEPKVRQRCTLPVNRQCRRLDGAEVPRVNLLKALEVLRV